MNYGQMFYNLNRDFKKACQKYDEAEDPDTQKQGFTEAQNVKVYTQQQVGMVQNSYYKQQFLTLLQQVDSKLADMEKNLGKIRQKAVAEGGGRGGQGDKDDDGRQQGILDAIVQEKPNVKWEDIAGLNEAKKNLNEALIMPIKFPNFFVGNVKPWKGILLYGPPGTGKTFLAKACATECESTFFSISSSDLMSKYMGESEKMIKALFKMANEKAPSIIFTDEIDSMCGKRGEGENESSRRVKTEFLVQMQGVGNKNERVLVLGATNLPWALDPAVRRRFERRVYIDLPDFDARRYLIKRKLKGLDKALSDQDIDQIAHQTNGYSGADLEILCRNAAYEPLTLAQTTNKFIPVMDNGRQKYMPVPMNYNGGNVRTTSVYQLEPNTLVLPNITRDNLLQALQKSKPSVSQSDLKQYEDWTKQFGSSD